MHNPCVCSLYPAGPRHLGAMGKGLEQVELEILQIVGGYDLRSVVFPKDFHARRPQKKHLSLIRGSLCQVEKKRQ